MTPQERALLERLLRRAHPTELQRELIARLQTKAGLPIEPGPAAARYRRIVEARRIERARLSILGPAGEPTLRYSYARIIEMIPRTGRGRIGRFNIIRVDSPVPLVGAGLEEAFRLAIKDFRRLVRYGGPLWYANPEEEGLRLPDRYVEPLDYYAEDYFEGPEDLGDETLYIDR